ncbi:MAG: hypothetical protein OXI24_16965, partial [Candidatus Poribacteria bacterium]|nr:hypothetical protein [Candidatus Poribacteria bacterium]
MSTVTFPDLPGLGLRGSDTDGNRNYNTLRTVKVYSAVGYGVNDDDDGVHPFEESNDLRPSIFSINENRILGEADTLNIQIFQGSSWHQQNVISTRDRIVVHRSTIPDDEDGTEHPEGDYYRLYRVVNVRLGTGEQSKYGIEAWSIDEDLTKNLYRHYSTLTQTDRGRSLRVHDFGSITVREVLEEIFERSNSLPENFKIGYIDPRLRNLEVFPYFRNSKISECLAILNREVHRHGTQLEYEIEYCHVANRGFSAGDIVFHFVESRGASEAERAAGNYLLDIGKRVIVAQPQTGPGNRVGATIQNIQDDYVSRAIPNLTDNDFQIGIAGVVWDAESRVYNSVRDETTIVLEDGCIGFDDQFNYDGSEQSDWGIRD